MADFVHVTGPYVVDLDLFRPTHKRKGAAMPKPEKTYLGDAVYVEIRDGDGALVLTTEDGIRATNTIVLERDVLDALGAYIGLLQAWVGRQ